MAADSGCGSSSLSFNRQSLELRSGQDPSLLHAEHAEHAAVNQRRRQRRTEENRSDSWFRHSMPPAINRDFESIENLKQSPTNRLDEQLTASFAGKLTHSGSVSTASGGTLTYNNRSSAGDSGSLTVCHGSRGHTVGGIRLNSANSNLGFIDSDEPNTPSTPLQSTSASIYGGHQHGSVSGASVTGTFSSMNANAGGGVGEGGSNVDGAEGCSYRCSAKRKSKCRKSSRGSILSGNSVRSRASAMAARGLRLTVSFLRRKRKEYEGKLCRWNGDDDKG